MSSRPAASHESPQAPAVAGPESPFEQLSACHAQVERVLRRLEQLERQLPDRGCDRDAVEAAREALRCFDQAVPVHHQVEERHVLPALRELGDDAFAAQLEQEHAELRRRWSRLRRALMDIVNGTWCSSGHVQAIDGLASFAVMSRAHAAAEAEQAYPAVRATLTPDQQRAIADEMARPQGRANASGADPTRAGSACPGGSAVAPDLG